MSLRSPEFDIDKSDWIFEVYWFIFEISHSYVEIAALLKLFLMTFFLASLILVTRFPTFNCNGSFVDKVGLNWESVVGSVIQAPG